MSSGRPSLPEYAHPPLVAATLGVFFERPLEITGPQRTEYQRRLGPEWIGTWAEVSPENVDATTDVGLLNRGWQLENVLHDRVIRVSPAHFSFTWLGTADTRYPRYESVRDGFVAAWDQFAAPQEFPSHRIHRWGTCYLNRIPRGTVWQSSSDWSFFRLLPDAPRLVEQITSAHWTLKTPGVDDGLKIDWTVRPASPTAEEQTLWLRLTASGTVGPESSALLDGMDGGRAAIVQTFSDLLSPAANSYWGLRRRDK